MVQPGITEFEVEATSTVKNPVARNKPANKQKHVKQEQSLITDISKLTTT